MTDETKAPPTARNDEDTTRLATNLYEHVRQLNYATAGPPSLTLPSTAYAILGNLSAATYGLDQLLNQINHFFLRELPAGRLGHDRGEDLIGVLSRHGLGLAEARRHGQALSAALYEAQSAINAVHCCSAQGREPDTTFHGKADERDAGVAAAAEDFPSLISDPPLIEPPPTSERPSPIRTRRTNTTEA